MFLVLFVIIVISFTFSFAMNDLLFIEFGPKIKSRFFLRIIFDLIIRIMVIIDHLIIFSIIVLSIIVHLADAGLLVVLLEFALSAIRFLFVPVESRFFINILDGVIDKLLVRC